MNSRLLPVCLWLSSMIIAADFPARTAQYKITVRLEDASRATPPSTNEQGRPMSIRDYNIEQIARTAISIVLLIVAGANCHAQEQVTLRRVEVTGLRRLTGQ